MRPARWVFIAFAVIATVALGIRFTFVLTEARYDTQYYDAAYYERAVDLLVDGHGFVDPFELAAGRSTPAADHPPLTVLALAPVAWVTGSNEVAMRLSLAALGVVNVILIGLLGRRVAGDLAGVVAAGIAAVYPLLWVNDGLFMSETLSVTFTVLAMLLTYRLLERTTLVGVALLGVVCGLAGLSRGELVLLAPALVLGIAIATRRQGLGACVRLVAVGAVATMLTLTPWIAYNLARFERPTFLTASDGINIRGGACDTTFYGPTTGLVSFTCLQPIPPGDQSVRNAVYRDRGVEYIQDHLGRYPVVLLARVGRVWSVWRPGDALLPERVEGRPRAVTEAGYWFYYPMLALAVGGVVLLARRRVQWWPLLVAPVIVTVSVIAAWGLMRYRVPAEPSLVVLAAVSITAAVDAARRRRARDVATAPA